MPNREINVPLSRTVASSELKKSIALIVLLIICSFAVCNIVAPSSIRYIARQLSIPFRDDTSLVPKDHGLPSVILGYTILAVETPQNTPCIPAGVKRVVVQGDGPAAQTFLTNGAPVGSSEVISVLHEIDPEVTWKLRFVGPGTTFDTIARSSNAWIAGMAPHCAKLGGPIGPTVTPRS